MAKRKSPEDDLTSSAPKKRRPNTSPNPESGPATVNPTPSFGLLRLPPEIRNQIYECVLTTDSGQLKFNAHPNPENRHFYWRQTGNMISLPEFNKLRHVSRETYQETAFFEYKFNTLVFEQVERAELEPEKQLLTLESLCPPASFDRITRIELHIKALATPYSMHHQYFLENHHLDAYARIARFCRQHPGIEVKYVLNSFTWHASYHLGPESRGFINQGIVLLKALRNIDVSYLNPDPVAAQELLEIGAGLRSRRNKTSWYAPNLRFYPNQHELDEDSFRVNAGKSYEGVVGGLEKWIEVTKSWVKNGF